MNGQGAASTAQLVAALSLLAKAGRSFETKLAGMSMGAAIPDGAVVRIVSNDPETLTPGDVFAFRDDTRIVAHRLVRRGRHGDARRYVIALGDGNRFPDPPIPLEAILGKVVAYFDGSIYREIPPARRRPLLDAIMSGAAVRAMIVATEIHVPLARWLAGFTIFTPRGKGGDSR
jgi:hypothetical protein